MNRDCRTGLPPLRRPEAVVFDMDGVLFDTEPLYREAASIAGNDLGYVLPTSLADRVIGLSWPRTRLLFVDAFGPSFPLEEFMAVWLHRFDELAATRLRTKPGVRELIHTLDQLAVPRAIATGSLSATARRHLAAHALADSFAAIVAHEDCAAGKPAADPFLKAADRLGIAPEVCIAIEDSYNGVRSAAAAGMMTIMVPDLIPPNEEMRALCVRVAKDLHEVDALIRAAIHEQGITDGL
jgi:HAD superfamily hydrolase (TIGR01509 family)